MIKQIKQYFNFKWRMYREILETLCSICMWLEYDGRFSHNPYSRSMRSHIVDLKSLSEELRGNK